MGFNTNQQQQQGSDQEGGLNSFLYGGAAFSQALSTGLSIYGQNMQTKAAVSTYNNNARLSREEADRIERESLANEYRGHANQSRAVGEVTAQRAASGFTGEGSGSREERTVYELYQIDIEDSRRAALSQAAAYRQQALYDEQTGRAIKKANKRARVGTLLEGAAKTAAYAAMI